MTCSPPSTPLARLTPAERQARDREVARQHALYFDYNQRPHQTSERFSRAGHPLARPYRAIAKRYFSTKYCSNSATRLLAYAILGDASGGQIESVSISRPEICESWSVHKDIGGTYFGWLYPASPQWPVFVDAMIATRFVHTNAHLSPNFIRVNTGRASVRAEFLALTEAFACLRFSSGGNEQSFSIEIASKPSIEAIHAVFGLIKQQFKPYLLPKCSPTEPVPELPLPDKHFYLSNVQTLTVTPTAILVPQIPFGEKGQVLLAENVDKLMSLVSQGYPFSGSVEAYLSQHLRTPQLKKLKAKYAKG